MNIILQIVLSAIATMGFSVIFNVPKKELIFCGLTGAAGWLIFMVVTNASDTASATAATFFAAATVTAFARILSTMRKMPSSLYMVPGIIPLVPGIRIYFTMFYVINGDNTQALLEGIEALKLAGVIAIGLLTVLSLPRRLFALRSVLKNQ
jgi:uncharacterized membrane protein YjjB (DUF3815 family)